MATAKKISALTAVSSPAGSDVLAVKQGATTKKLTVTQLLTLQDGDGNTDLPFGIQFYVEVGADVTYVIDQSASFAYTIIDAVAETDAGTITVAVKIDGVDVAGISAMEISDTESTDTATDDNSVAAGAKVILVFSSNSAATLVSVKLSCTRD